MTNRPSFLNTILVLALEVPHPNKLLNLRQIRKVGQSKYLVKIHFLN